MWYVDVNACRLLFDFQFKLFSILLELLIIVYFVGNLNSSANIVDMKVLSRCGGKKIGTDFRSFRVYSLFGGKKDDNENSDEAPSKVSL